MFPIILAGIHRLIINWILFRRVHVRWWLYMKIFVLLIKVVISIHVSPIWKRKKERKKKGTVCMNCANIEQWCILWFVTHFSLSHCSHPFWGFSSRARAQWDGRGAAPASLTIDVQNSLWLSNCSGKKARRVWCPLSFPLELSMKQATKLNLPHGSPIAVTYSPLVTSFFCPPSAHRPKLSTN